MPLTKRLRLDEIYTSFPELGPTVPDGGYAWIVLCGVFLVQMTVPSVLAMYGIVLAYIRENKTTDFDMWSEKIILTPIIFTAFWNLADPWTRMIVNIASIPRLLGITGVILLAVGIIASGYLATGGVGVYLASTSAGAVMGIGASFTMVLSDYILRKYFRKKLLIALTLRNVGASFGLVLIPSITNLLLHEAKLKVGLQLMTTVLLPTVLGTLTFRLPSLQQTSPYSLLLSTEEDTELPIRIASDDPKDLQDSSSQDYIGNFDYVQAEETAHSGGLLNEGNNIYAYEELDEDVDLFVNPVVHSNNQCNHQLRALANFQLWAAIIGWVGMKASALFFWLLLPALSYEIVSKSYFWMSLSIMAGFSTFLPNLVSYKVLKLTNQNRRLYFGTASWLSGVSLIYAATYPWMIIFAFLGGISLGSLSICQDLALYDVLGSETVRSVHKGFSTVVGLCIFIFCFVRNVHFCLSLTALLQFLGGLYWISSPFLNLIKAIRYRSRTMNNASRDET
ncbi:Monocarboxylate transporter 5 [Habropoda laboriosa]|uniref:Monocarboxylate transporter 5 n=1 Tax=Habropoda laboriosa TaxID=597456 RepID=A0A0L7QQX4_9HYME|nr:Monocarboxylate transporter 5 [Habropoda laboriosa]